uniref:DNA 3'-5' helicase n=1 Tax=Desulfovibrio sp. U5L TaxID=596152 RepID=I2Q069_9BACT
METPNPSCAARATLDPDQLAAVTTKAHRALVLAGAGSGKTRVLTERIAYLIEECHASPSEIVAVTFTRKAAAEMRERLLKRIGNKAYGVTMGTMHALALVQLRRFGELIGLRPENITVYSEWEESYLLREVAREVGALRGKTWKVPKKDVDAAFGAYYATGAEPDKLHSAGNLFCAFMARCRENNALTYGGLLTGFRLLLPRVMEYLGWRHVLVDEVQDLDRLQWGIIEALAWDLPASLFACGDIDQSLYSWRGACPGYLLANAHTFEVLRLERNYRSGAGIVEAANRLIGHNTARLPKTMKASRGVNAAVMIREDMDSAAVTRELDTVVPVLAQPGEVAILARKHVLLQRVAEELDALGVPYLYVGQKAALTNTEEFRRFHAFLKLLVNPFDNFAFLLIRDALGVSDDEFAIIRGRAIREDKSHLRAWLDAHPSAAGMEGSLANFFRFQGGEEPAEDACREVFYRLHLEEDAKATGPVFDFIDAYCEGRPPQESTVSAYLSWLATYDVQDEIPAADPDGPGVVTLATIHGAKGLEWPYVILAGCNEGILPSDRAIRAGDLEEERRLAYVAITRARDCLTLAVRPERSEKPGRDGEVRVYESPVSRFVAEAMGGEA